MATCQNCHTEIPEGSIKCPSCHKLLIEVELPSEEPEAPSGVIPFANDFEYQITHALPSDTSIWRKILQYSYCFVYFIASSGLYLYVERLYVYQQQSIYRHLRYHFLLIVIHITLAMFLLLGQSFRAEQGGLFFRFVGNRLVQILCIVFVTILVHLVFRVEVPKLVYRLFRVYSTESTYYPVATKYVNAILIMNPVFGFLSCFTVLFPLTFRFFDLLKKLSPIWVTVIIAELLISFLR